MRRRAAVAAPGTLWDVQQSPPRAHDQPRLLLVPAGPAAPGQDGQGVSGAVVPRHEPRQPARGGGLVPAAHVGGGDLQRFSLGVWARRDPGQQRRPPRTPGGRADRRGRLAAPAGAARSRPDAAHVDGLGRHLRARLLRLPGPGLARRARRLTGYAARLTPRRVKLGMRQWSRLTLRRGPPILISGERWGGASLAQPVSPRQFWIFALSS